MKGYKVFNPDWTCRGFQYEVGKTYEEDVVPDVCKVGFHFCQKLADCFGYYNFDPNNKVAEIEALGDIDEGDNKCCTNKITIVQEITWQEVLEMVNTGKGDTGNCNSGNYNSGDWNKASNVVGCFTPPFREMSDEEYRQLAEQINSLEVDIVWIGISTPKQERFAVRLAQYTQVHFICTVGAAFDFHTDRVREAPRWMQQHGLEWFFRLITEPRRLWRRYIKVVPLFIL